MEFFLNKNLVFIDSMQFMNYSLKDLVKNLSDNDFKYLTDFQIFQIFQIFDENYLTCNKIWNKFSMKNMSDYHDHYFQKDVLLLADVFEKFIDMCLNIYNFHQIFQIFQIFDENYLTCNKIWNKFSMKNMSDYHDHYFQKDVLLLADVFEKFIDMCLNIYGLDPCHYFSSPGLSWDVILKMTGVRLNCRH